MRFFTLLAVSLAVTPVAAQDWLTIFGDPDASASDVIQISPALNTWQGRQLTFEVRTSRRTERMGYAKVPYRSYRGLAVVDCESRKGWYLSITYYAKPRWEGEPFSVVNYKPEEAPMAFADIPGAPAARVVHAACGAVR